jgi:endoglucanase
MTRTPSAVWFTKGSPSNVRNEVNTTVNKAVARGRVPVLVAYYLPFRDCAQYSAGGALSVADYKAWIDGFAAGIGDRKAVVILEPDGLGIIPWYTTINGTQDWCQPTAADPATAAADRFAMLNYAVDALKAKPNASVYLDGTHSAWLGVGDAADRLVKAGVQRANGLYVNVSNYQPTPQLLKYGTWIAKCIHYGTNPAEGGWRLGHFDYCASQYYPATPSDFSTWGLTDQWYADNVDNAANPPSGPDALAHFVVDTSRNGQGPWTVPPGTTYPDPQDWCNPPNRGVGLRPSTDTGNPLADAFLWIKIPGESDGQCDRGTGTGLDPARGNMADPAAGAWFPQQALELARLATPPLMPTP